MDRRAVKWCTEPGEETRRFRGARGRTRRSVDVGIHPRIPAENSTGEYGWDISKHSSHRLLLGCYTVIQQYGYFSVEAEWFLVALGVNVRCKGNGFKRGKQGGKGSSTFSAIWPLISHSNSYFTGRQE